MARNRQIPKWHTGVWRDLFAFIGAWVYIVQVWLYAHTQLSILDEGAYLVKGYYFATGVYRPFQDYGPWTNHMPLAYLFPGYAQVLFGPGLRTGRYFAIFIAILFLAGVWLLARRLNNPLWGAFVVWALALNPALIKMYSVVASQGLVACLLVWALLLVIGPKRAHWQVLLGVGLAALIPLTRLNMTPVLVFIVAYIFWEYGQRTGWWAAAIGSLIFVGGNLRYWPNILRLWVKWFPQAVTPFLDAWRPEIGAPVWQPQIDAINRFWSFMEGLRFHFIPVVGVLVVLLLWPSKQNWKKRSDFRSAVLLLSLFGVLWGLHAWASLGKNYCVFCYSVYLAFFSFLGLLFIVVVFPSIDFNPPKTRRWLAIALILAVTLSVGASLYIDLGENIFSDQAVRRFIRTEIPRFDGFRLRAGKVELQGFLANYFGWDYREVQLQVKRFLTMLLFTGFGLAVALFSLLAGKLLSKKWFPAWPTPVLSLLVLLGLGLVLSPTEILGGSRHTYDCDSNVIESYEKTGAYLNEIIPPGTTIFWRGGLSTVPLLYLDDVEIFPPQLNNDYSFRVGGNPNTLVKYGLWNQEVALQWMDQADVILVEDRFYKGWLIDHIESQNFPQSKPAPPSATCRKDAEIYIYWSTP